MFSLCQTIHAFVVELFAIDSQFKPPYSYPTKDLSNKLHFRDYFNVQVWNELSIENNATPVTSWNNFLTKKPKKFIFAAIINACGKASTHQ